MTNTELALNIVAMIEEGMQPIDCLNYVIGEGVEYSDAIWLVTRVLKLDNDAVLEMEECY